jgi:hypothetical protein
MRNIISVLKFVFLFINSNACMEMFLLRYLLFGYSRKLILNDQYNKNDIKKLYIHVMTIFALKLLFFDRMASDDAETRLLAIKFYELL